MSIETALVSLLSNDADVSAKVGNRIFPVFVPEGQNLPAITYQEISGIRDSHMTGASGLVNARYQINVWTTKYRDARELADLVRIALSPESDTYPDTIEGMSIQAIMLLNENDVPSVHAENEEMSGHGKMLDFSVWFKE